MGRGVLVDVEGLVHIYRTDDLEVVALQGLDLQVAEREMIAIVGRGGRQDHADERAGRGRDAQRRAGARRRP